MGFSLKRPRPRKLVQVFNSADCSNHFPVQSCSTERVLCCPKFRRRIQKSLASISSESGRDTLEERLRVLLNWLQWWRRADEDILADRTPSTEPPNDIVTELRRAEKNIRPSAEGPRSWLKFWKFNSGNIQKSSSQIQEAGKALMSKDVVQIKEKFSLIDLDWLRSALGSGRQRHQSHPSTLPSAAIDRLDEKVSGILAFVAESLCPWDYDRREFGLTFTNSWVDREAPSLVNSEESVVKLTSTIKPFYKEWKLSARSKLMSLGEQGLIFGKAAVYLAGEQPAYVGLEVDRLVNFPKLKRTKAFFNTNYRSSRKPRSSPVIASVGLQQTFSISKTLSLTIRFGVSTRNSGRLFYLTPVPHGLYF